MADKEKTLEPQHIPEAELPSPISYYEITDAPQTLQELDQAAATQVAAATAAITGLGDLAYEDLVTELQLADDAVTNAKIAVDAIQGDVIAAAAITETKIATNSISSGKIQAAAVIAGKIAANAVTATEIAADAVIASKIQAGAVVAGKIAAGAIDGITITGSIVRTSSSGTRVQMSTSLNALQVFSGSTERMRLEGDSMYFYNSSGTLVVAMLVSSSTLLMSAQISGGNIYVNAGSSGDAALAVGGTPFFWADGGLNQNVAARDIVPTSPSVDLGASGNEFGDLYIGEIHSETDITVDDGVIRVLDGFIRLASMSGAQADARSDDLVNGNMYVRTDDNVLRVRLGGSWRTVTTS